MLFELSGASLKLYSCTAISFLGCSEVGGVLPNIQNIQNVSKTIFILCSHFLEVGGVSPKPISGQSGIPRQQFVSQPNFGYTKVSLKNIQCNSILKPNQTTSFYENIKCKSLLKVFSAISFKTHPNFDHTKVSVYIFSAI